MGFAKQAGLIAALIGIAVVVGLTIWSGLDSVGHAVASVGWGIVLVVMVRVAAVSAAGTGWWLLFPPVKRPRLRMCVFLRFIREAVNVLLPITQIGGDLIGAALLTLRGVPGSLAAASIIVDILMQAATQFLFGCLGLLALVALGANPALSQTAAIGLAVAALMLTGFYLAQRRAGYRILRWTLTRLSGDREWRVLGRIDNVYDDLTNIYVGRLNLLASGAAHLAGWLFGVTEVMIVFAFMGSPLGLGEAFVIEGLLQAIRGAAFAVPSALGAQEAALVLLCAVFGIPPGQAIALSFVKRTADLALGAPSLLAWQMPQWGRLLPSYSADKPRPHSAIDPWSQDR